MGRIYAMLRCGLKYSGIIFAQALIKKSGFYRQTPRDGRDIGLRPMRNFNQSAYLFQAQPVPPDLVARLLGNRVAVSPIVTVEPRRRKFHRPITLTIPLPRAAHKGMLNECSPDSPTLHLLCSITGKSRK